MNILMVYPEYPNTFWSFKKVLRFISKKATFPPLGLLTVASLLPKDWNLRLIDLNIRALDDKDIQWADMIFLSAMIVQKESVKKIIARCKYLNKTIVAGGPLFNTQHEKFTGIDHFILNEAEVTLPMFLEDLHNKNLKPVYTSDKFPDIRESPIPMWSLIDFRDYTTMLIQYSRGCPFDCEFCDVIIMNGRVPRTKSPEQVIRELDSLLAQGGSSSLFIVDDNFIGNKFEVKKMLRALIEWQKKHDYPLKVFTEASADLADDEELMALMRDANFHKVFLGLETPNVDSLKECNKFQNVKRDLVQVVKKIHQYGMQVMGGFIVGFDQDNETIFDRQIDFIQKSGVVTAMVGLLTALPKTKLWHRLKEEGRLIAEATGQNTDACLNFMPKMDKDKLIAGYKNLLQTIYSSKNYYQRINTFLKDYRPAVKTKLDMVDVKAFFKSVWSIGIMSRNRFKYWKLLAKTFFTNAKAIPIAVELAIIGIHFENLSQFKNKPTI